MTSHSEDHRPYVLWFETLPNGETVTVVIWPWAGRAELAAQRNLQLFLTPSHVVIFIGRHHMDTARVDS